MTREDRKMYWRLGITLFYSFLGIWLAAELVLLAHPPTELDKKCLRESLAQQGQCYRDFKAGK